MLTRRLGLLTSAFALVAWPALAQPKKSPAARAERGGRRGKDAISTGSPADTALGAVDTAAKWAIVQDFNTGAVLLEKQADEEMAPSSMTKLMTMYIVYDRLKQGRMRLMDELPVTEKAWRMQGV